MLRPNRNLVDQAATQLQPQELPVIEHFAVMPVAPTVQPVGFITGRDCLIRDEAGAGSLPAFFSNSNALQILGIRLLEESALMTGLARRVLIFNGEQAVPRGCPGRC